MLALVAQSLCTVLPATALAQGATDERPVLLHTSRAQAPAGAPLEIEGSLIGSKRVAKVVIRYRGPVDDYLEAPMELQYGDLYRGTIPSEKLVPPGVEYFVEGTLRTGEKTALFATAERPARVLVVGSSGDPIFGSRPRNEGNAGSSGSSGTGSGKRRNGEPNEPVLVEPPEEPAPASNTASSNSANSNSNSNTANSRSNANSNSKPSELEEELALYTAVDTVALATRQDEKVQKAPAIAASYGRAQIRALGARTVHDVLDVIPGVTVSRDVQGFHRTAVRGLRSDPEVAFLLNGQPLNNVYDGRALANLPIENVERIEVIRGPGSALHGTGAFLGVVNIVTVGEDESLRGAASGGSFDAFSGHLGANRKFGALTLQADADVLRQTGYRKPIVEDALEFETRRQRLRTQLDPSGETNDRRLLFNIGAGARYETESAGQLSLSLRFLDEDRAALVGLYDTVGPDSDLHWSVLLGSAGWRRPFGERVTAHARVGYTLQSTTRLFQLTPRDYEVSGAARAEGLLERTRAVTSGLSADVGVDLQLFEGNRLSLGLQAQQATLTGYAYETNHLLDENGNVSEYLGTEFRRPTEEFEYPQEIADGVASRRTMLGLYAHDQWQIVEPLSITAGFRVDAVRLPTVDLDGNITGASFVPSFNPRAGLVWSVSDPLVLKLLYGRAFRAPTMSELAESVPEASYNQGRFRGNAALDPATVDTLELGADLIQAAGDARVRVRGNLFYESFSNAIAAVDDSGNVIPLRNRAEGVRVFGAEGEARLEASDRAITWVNASWFRALDLEADLPLLTDVPQLRVNAGMSMPIGAWLNFDLLVKIGVERRNNSRTALEYLRRYRLPPYALMGAQLRTQKLFDHVEVTLSGHNLLDLDWADDVPRPDRMRGAIPREGISGFLTVRGEL